jgi:hypothetical protein
MLLKNLMRHAFVSAVTLACSLSASATQVTLSTDQSRFNASTNQGWWADNTSNDTLNANHFTGSSMQEGAPGNYRSFYTFDLSGVAGPINGATLRVMRGYQSGLVDLQLWDVTSGAGAVNDNGSMNPTIFDDLGSGVAYGSYLIDTGDYSDNLTLALNANALADLNAAHGFLTIGAALQGMPEEYIFSGTGRDVTYLDLEIGSVPGGDVPEPSSAALLVISAAALALARRRRI